MEQKLNLTANKVREAITGESAIVHAFLRSISHSMHRYIDVE